MSTNNKIEFSTSLPLQLEKLKRTLLPTEGLIWTDILVLCTLDHLQKELVLIEIKDIVRELGMNRVWVYQSINRLHKKDLIQVTPRHQTSSFVSLNGWGKLLLFKVEDYINGHEPYTS